MGEVYKVHRAKFFDYMPSGIQCIAYDQESQTLAVGRSDGTIDIWKTGDNWYHQKTIPGSEQRNVNSLVWVKGRLFSAGLQGNITEYDLVKLSPKVSHFYGHGFWCMSVSHDKTTLALGCEDGCVRLYKVLPDKGVVYERAFDFQSERVISLSWHCSGELIVTGSVDNIRVWNVSTGQVKQRITIHRIHRHVEVTVWCVAILRDFTIVSGDSQGLTQFWDAKTGTGIKSISTHRAAILSLCVSPNEESVCTAGIDPKVVQFRLVQTTADRSAHRSANESHGGRREWVKVTSTKDHFHDVKALAIVGNGIVSGGTDAILRTTPIHRPNQHKYGPMMAMKRNDLPFPSKPLVHAAVNANLVLCQHQNSLDLWRLGTAGQEIKGLQDGDAVSLESRPSKLIELRSKSGEGIICSALSPSGSWLAFSTVEKIRLYKVTYEPLVLHKVPVIPGNVLPSHHLEFTPNDAKLLSVTNQRSVQLLALDDIHPTLLHTQTVESSITNVAMSDRGAVAVLADENGKLTLFNFKDPTKKIESRLPCYKPVTAMTLNPSGTLLFVVYSDRTFQEFNLHQQSYTSWSSSRASQYYGPQQWLGRKQAITRVQYKGPKDNQILMVENTSITILSKKKPPPLKGQLLFSSKSAVKRTHEGNTKQKQAGHGLVVCEKYKPIMYAGFLGDSETLLVVERPIQAIYEKLPPAFHAKKFGT